MDDLQSRIADAVVKELIAQGQGGGAAEAPAPTAYPVRGTLNIVTLARAVELALGEDQGEDGVPPSHLNATNDG